MRVINTINRDRMALANYIVIKITKVDLRRRRRASRTHRLARIHFSAVDVHRRQTNTSNHRRQSIRRTRDLNRDNLRDANSLA